MAARRFSSATSLQRWNQMKTVWNPLLGQQRVQVQWRVKTCILSDVFWNTDFSSAIPDRQRNLAISLRNNDTNSSLHLWHHLANLNVFRPAMLQMGGCQPKYACCSKARVINYIITIRITINQFNPVQEDPSAGVGGESFSLEFWAQTQTPSPRHIWCLNLEQLHIVHNWLSQPLHKAPTICWRYQLRELRGAAWKGSDTGQRVVAAPLALHFFFPRTSRWFWIPPQHHWHRKTCR